MLKRKLTSPKKSKPSKKTKKNSKTQFDDSPVEVVETKAEELPRTGSKKSNPSKKRKQTKKNSETQFEDSSVEVVETKACDQEETVTDIVVEEGPWKNLELILSLQSNTLGFKK